MERRFTKIKFDPKKGMVHLEYKSGKQLLDEYTMKCTEAPHPNFLKSLEVFKTHVTDICELPAEYAERIIVRGISLNYGGEDDVMGCVIIAGMELQNSNAPLNLNTPNKIECMYNPDMPDDEKVLMSADMREDIEELIHEANLYVEGERAQTNLFAEEVKEPQDAELIEGADEPMALPQAG